MSVIKLFHFRKCAAFASLLGITVLSNAAPLDGCWRFTSSTTTFKDGTSKKNADLESGKLLCTRRYVDSTIVHRCTTKETGKAQITKLIYSIRGEDRALMAQNGYTEEVVENDGKPTKNQPRTGTYTWGAGGSFFVNFEYPNFQSRSNIFLRAKDDLCEAPSPSEAAGTQAAANAQNAPKGAQQQDGGWDKWLETTGNKTKVAPPVAPSTVRVAGTPPAGTEEVVKVCQHLVNLTGSGKPGIGSIFSIEYLAPVDAASVYGNMGPQGKLTPLRLHALFRDGEKYFANGYLQKDAFGDFKCIAAR